MASLNGITAQYNKKSSAVKRIMQEARELAREPSTDFAANPLESDIFEWHFTIRGPEGTDFEGGLYHGRILLPNNYPFAPPSLMFLTPNGRFELNKKVCLSITGYHPEYWQPAWGIRTVLVAVMGFLPTESKGAIGGLDTSVEARKALAIRSKSWQCKTCKMDNVEILPNIAPEQAVKAQLKESEKADFSFGYEADKKAASPSPEQQQQQQQATEQPQPPSLEARPAATVDGPTLEGSTAPGEKEENQMENTVTRPTDGSGLASDLQGETLAGTGSPRAPSTVADTATTSPAVAVATAAAEARSSGTGVEPTRTTDHSLGTAPPAPAPGPVAMPVAATATAATPVTPTPGTNSQKTATTEPSRSSMAASPTSTPLPQPWRAPAAPAVPARPAIPIWFDALIVALGGILVALILRKLL